MRRTIEIDFDVYVDMLEERKEFIKKHFGWTIPDGVWEYALQLFEECGVSNNSSPSYIVDNIAVNGDYCLLEDSNIDLDELKDTWLQENPDEDDPEPEYDEDELWNEWRDRNRSRADDGMDTDFIKEWVEKNGKDIFFTYDEPDSQYGVGVCFFL